MALCFHLFFDVWVRATTLTHGVTQAGTLHVYYWVCAFSVNQHASICSGPFTPTIDSLNNPIEACKCSVTKVCHGSLMDGCRVNKSFRHYTKRIVAQRGAFLSRPERHDKTTIRRLVVHGEWPKDILKCPGVAVGVLGL